MHLLYKKLIFILLGFLLINPSSSVAFNLLNLQKKEVPDTDKRTPLKRKYDSFQSDLFRNSFFDSFDAIERMHSKMQEQMSQAFSNSFSQLTSPNNLDIQEYEDDKNKYIEVSLEGIDKSSLEVNVQGGVISLTGRSQHVRAEDGIGRSEFISSFSRSFSTPSDVHEEKVKITTNNEKLVLKFPKKNV